MMLQCEKPEDFVVATNKPLGALLKSQYSLGALFH